MIFRILPVISDYNSKLYPITRQVLNTNTKCLSAIMDPQKP